MVRNQNAIREKNLLKPSFTSSKLLKFKQTVNVTKYSVCPILEVGQNIDLAIYRLPNS